jgi:hypothetical protein
MSLIIRGIAVAFIVVLLTTFTSSVGAQQQTQPPIMTLPDQQLAPYFWGKIEEADYTPQGLADISAKKDPLALFVVAFRALHQFKVTGSQNYLEASEHILDFMLDDYEPAVRGPNGTRWYYGNDYGAIKAPWWSGMDAMLGPLTLYTASELNGNARYREEAIKSARLVLGSPDKGGILWNDDGKCWLSEYSWNGIQRDQEYQVLNGNLWALQALFLLAKATGDPILSDAYACGHAGFVANTDRFYRDGGEWTSYSLNPPDINPVHYNTLEFVQLTAMYLLTGDGAYQTAAQRRQKIFATAYPLSLIGADGQMEVIFSMVGAPHPYWTDTYPVTVSCWVTGHEIKRFNDRTFDAKFALRDRLVVSVPVRSRPTKCSVTLHTPTPVLMYEQTEFTVENQTQETLPISLNVMFDAVSVDGGLVHVRPSHEERLGIHSSNDEARISMAVDAAISNQDILALAVTVPVTVDLAILIEDEIGNVATRYYLPLTGGRRNLVLLNRLGFQDNDVLAKKIKTISLRLFTNSAMPQFDVELDHFTVLRTPAEIRDWFIDEPEAYFPQQ